MPAGGLAWQGGVRVGGQDPVELAARADPKLGKDAAEVVAVNIDAENCCGHLLIDGRIYTVVICN